MNILEFLQLSAGHWFSQRTIHNLGSEELITGKSELDWEILPVNDPAVVQLCQLYQRDVATATLGMRITWDGTPGRDQPKQKGATLWVSILDPNNDHQAEILVEPTRQDNRLMKCHASLGKDEVLTLITDAQDLQVEERLWYLMPNLRVRSSIVKQSNQFTHASFYSEIRMGVKK